MSEVIEAHIRTAASQYLRVLGTSDLETRFQNSVVVLASEAAGDLLGGYAADWREARKKGVGLEQAKLALDEATILFIEITSWPVHIDEATGLVVSDT